MEINIKEVEVQKLNIQPGEVLVISIKTISLEEEDLADIKRSFEQLFPNNKVVIFSMTKNSKVEFTTIKDETANLNSGCCGDCECSETKGE
jgi:hypothetical protein